MNISKNTGPFKVGCVDIMTKATKIPSDLSPSSLCSSDADLGIFVTLYYPCESDISDDKYKPNQWMPSKHNDWYTNGMSYKVLCTRHFGFIVNMVSKRFVQDALVDAPLIAHDMWKSKHCHLSIKENQRLPLIVNSHGLSGCRSYYSAFNAQLASEGFVVAAIEHRDGSACASYIVDDSGNDIEIPYFWETITDDDDKDKFNLRNMQLERRTHEVKKLLDLLKILNSFPEKIENIFNDQFDLTVFKGRLDTSQPIMIGHSFGGATTVNVLKKEPRFKCGIALDLWSVPLGEEAYKKEGLNKPLLAIMTEVWKWEKNTLRVKKYSECQPEGFVETVTLRNAGHLNQCDGPPVIPWWLHWFCEKGDLGSIDFEHSIDIQRKIISSYFIKYLQTQEHPVNLLDDKFDLHEDFIVGYEW